MAAPMSTGGKVVSVIPMGNGLDTDYEDWCENSLAENRSINLAPRFQGHSVLSLDDFFNSLCLMWEGLVYDDECSVKSARVYRALVAEDGAPPGSPILVVDLLYGLKKNDAGDGCIVVAYTTVEDVGTVMMASHRCWPESLIPMSMRNVPFIISSELLEQIKEHFEASADVSSVVNQMPTLDFGDYKLALVEPLNMNAAEFEARQKGVKKNTFSQPCVACGQPGGLLCSRCGIDRYCGKDCQRAMWKTHKKFCVAPEQQADNYVVFSTAEPPPARYIPEGIFTVKVQIPVAGPMAGGPAMIYNKGRKISGFFNPDEEGYARLCLLVSTRGILKGKAYLEAECVDGTGEQVKIYLNKVLPACSW